MSHLVWERLSPPLNMLDLQVGFPIWKHLRGTGMLIVSRYPIVDMLYKVRAYGVRWATHTRGGCVPS